MRKSTEQIKSKKLKTHTLKVVSEAKEGNPNESEFRAKLRQQGVDVLFRRNDEGRIYGATFVDHTTRTILNGSRLGKDYSANVFNDLYGGLQDQPQEPTRETQLSDIYANVKQSTWNESTSDNNVTGGLFSILAPEPENQKCLYLVGRKREGGMEGRCRGTTISLLSQQRQKKQ